MKDWTVPVQEATERLMSGKPPMTNCRMWLAQPLQVVVSHSGEIFGYFLAMRSVRIRGSFFSGSIAFVTPDK